LQLVHLGECHNAAAVSTSLAVHR